MSVSGGRAAAWVRTRFPALANPNYRRFWSGQCVSLIGTWMQQISLAWLVLSLTDSPLLLGLTGVLQFLPLTCFALFAGVIVDRYPKRRILFLTQSVSALSALTLALLVWTGTVHYAHILLLSFTLGCANAFDMPARQAMNIEMVGRTDLMNAVAINSMTFNLARIVGPSLGAVAMSAWGPGWCFFLNGLSYAAAILALSRIRMTPYLREREAGSTVWREIAGGFRYLAGQPKLGEVMLLVAVVGTFGYNFNVLIPVLARQTFHLEEAAFGVLMSCVGAGSLLGALTAGMRSRAGPKVAVSVGFSLAASACLAAVGAAAAPLAAGLLLFACGFLNITFATNSNAMLQLFAHDAYRARVMSIYSLVFAGSTPLGNLFAGWTADRYGAGGALAACGTLSLALCAVVIWRFRRAGRGEPEEARLPA